MMYIEHFVLLAGAYNLGFFIFYFLFFKLLCVYGKEKQNLFCKYKDEKQWNSAPPPKYAIRDTPVKDSEHLINHLHLSNDINT